MSNYVNIYILSRVSCLKVGTFWVVSHHVTGSKVQKFIEANAA